MATCCTEGSCKSGEQRTFAQRCDTFWPVLNKGIYEKILLKSGIIQFNSVSLLLLHHW